MFNNAYEVLGYLAGQCRMVEPVKDEFERLKKENEELKAKVETGSMSLLILMNKMARVEKEVIK